MDTEEPHHRYSTLAISDDDLLMMLVAWEKIEEMTLLDGPSKMKNKAELGIFIPEKRVDLSVRASPESSIFAISSHTNTDPSHTRTA